jgi:hypothetical protein
MCFVKIEELIKNDIPLDRFEYSGLDDELVNTYSSFESKFKELFKAYSAVHNLQNCFFYIHNSDSCNAAAIAHKGFNIIRINNGYPILIKDKFRLELFEKIIGVALVNEELIANAYLDLYQNQDFKFDIFMLNCSIAFTFHHEFRHLLQFNNSHSAKKFNYSENLDKDKFEIMKHAWEFDADRIASFEIIKYVFS